MKRTLLSALLLLAVLPASAGMRPVDETRPLSQDGRVEVELIAGSVTITAWDRDEVRITGTINDSFEELEVDADDREVSIVVDVETDGGKMSQAAQLEISVPRGSRLELETISADIKVDGTSGPVEVESVSGSIEIEGDMEVISVSSVSGKVDVRTQALLRRGEFESVSSDMEIRTDLADRASVSFESVNGDVDLYLPSGVSAEFEVETFNGKIENEFGPAARKTSEYLPSKELSFSTGSGSARVSVESFNGRVRLMKMM